MRIIINCERKEEKNRKYNQMKNCQPYNHQTNQSLTSFSLESNLRVLSRFEKRKNISSFFFFFVACLWKKIKIKNEGRERKLRNKYKKMIKTALGRMLL